MPIIFTAILLLFFLRPVLSSGCSFSVHGVSVLAPTKGKRRERNLGVTVKIIRISSVIHLQNASEPLDRIFRNPCEVVLEVHIV